MQKAKLKKITTQILETVDSFQKKNRENKKRLSALKTKISEKKDSQKIKAVAKKISQL